MRPTKIHLFMLAAGLTAGTALAAGAPRTWSFDKDAAGKAPPGFTFVRTGDGRPGRWVVEAAPDAPSGGKVLAQLDADETNARYPIAVADAPAVKDLRLSVRCKPISGELDQACGVVFRYGDEKNYYVTRANALEENVRLYHMKNGKRTQFATWDGKVALKAWHTLEVEAKGDEFRVFWDGKKVIEAKDGTFPTPGKVGVWTKADSVVHFDDLKVTPL